MVGDLDLARVHVGDELLDGAKPNPEFPFRIDPNLGITALVKMATPKLKFFDPFVQATIHTFTCQRLFEIGDSLLSC